MNLVVACSCNKRRDDQGLVHASCLREAIEVDDPEGGLPVCPYCYRPYAVEVQSVFSCSWKLLSCRSLRVLLEMVCLVSLFLVMSFMVLSLLVDVQEHPLSIALVILFVVIISMSVSNGLREKLLQWRNRNSIISYFVTHDANSKL